MFNDFKNRLNSIRAQGENICKTSDCIDAIHKSVDNELVTYSKLIPDFFSYDNEALKIKSLYKRLKELDYTRNRVISCIDVCRAGNLYAEYFYGMKDFINNLIDEALSPEHNNLSLMEKQLQTALNADQAFIDSLFGGQNNEFCEEEVTEAIKNLEYFIDFIDVLNEFHESVNGIFTRVETLFKNYPNIINAVRLISNSVCSASNRIIATIIDTYNDINNVLDDKTTTPTDNTFKVF